MKIHSLMALLSLLVFANCSSSCNSVPVTSLAKPETQQAIVLFHGLGDPVSAMDDNIRDLRQAFPNAEVVAFQRNEQQGIAAQAQKTYQDLQASDLHQRDLVFMGISAGGVVAIETLNQHPALAVRGIVAYHSPLEGAPIADQDIDTFVNSIKPFLPPELVSGVNTKIKQYTQGQAAQDLKPSSPFMATFKNTLSKVAVPILAMAGKGVSVTSLLQDFYRADLSSIAGHVDPLAAQLIGDSHHDGLLPMDSQLAEHINNSRIKRRCFIDVSHYEAIPSSAMEKIKKNIKSYFQP